MINRRGWIFYGLSPSSLFWFSLRSMFLRHRIYEILVCGNFFDSTVAWSSGCKYFFYERIWENWHQSVQQNSNASTPSITSTCTPTTWTLYIHALILLYYFDQFGRHASQGKWIWPKSVACPRSQRQWPASKNHWSKRPKKIFFLSPTGSFQLSKLNFT